MNFDIYSNEQIIAVQKLKNAGFSAKQINALNGLITNNYSYEEIISYFNPASSVNEISEFSSRLLEIINKKRINGGS